MKYVMYMIINVVFKKSPSGDFFHGILIIGEAHERNVYRDM